MSQYTIIDKKIHFLCEYRTAQETQTTKYVFWMAENELEIESDLMKVNAFFELRMNRSEIRLLCLLLIWPLMVHYSPEGINFHENLL